MNAKTIVIGEGGFNGNDNVVLQRAVDALAQEGGGTVKLPPGTFMMKDSLHLRSGVRVVGEGADTVLKKVPSVQSPLGANHGYGHYEVVIAEPDKFEPGMGVFIKDDKTGGFITTVATLLSRRGNAFIIDEDLKYDYGPLRGGYIASVYPIVTARHAEDVALLNVTLDGNVEETRSINGCRGGGVFLLQSHGVTVRDVEVVNFKGDAISFQQCTDVRILGCHLHHNAGHGLHPGSGSVRYVMRGNNVHDNGADAIFYCFRTTHSLCEGNRLHNNPGRGISIGERDTDHIIRSNEIYENGREGVLFRKATFTGGDRMTLVGNTFADNGRQEQEAQISFEEGISDVVVCGNSFKAPEGRQAPAPVVRVAQNCSRIFLFDNTVAGRAQCAEDFEDASGKVGFSEPDEPLKVGPEAAEADSCLHLRRSLPQQWADEPE